jgi:hypothetical protein
VRLSTSRKRLSRPGTIRLSGSVKGAAPGSRVLIARRLRGEAVGDQRLAAVAPDGTFRTTWRIGRTTRYVAQWIGDDDQAGDGSSTHTVHVRR